MTSVEPCTSETEDVYGENWSITRQTVLYWTLLHQFARILLLLKFFETVHALAKLSKCYWQSVKRNWQFLHQLATILGPVCTVILLHNQTAWHFICNATEYFTWLTIKWPLHLVAMCTQHSNCVSEIQSILTQHIACFSSIHLPYTWNMSF